MPRACHFYRKFLRNLFDAGTVIREKIGQPAFDQYTSRLTRLACFSVSPDSETSVKRL